MKVKQGKGKTSTFDNHGKGYASMAAGFEDALKGESRQRHMTPKPIQLTAEARMVLDLLRRGESLSLQTIRESIGVGAWDSIMLDRLHKRVLDGHDKVAEQLIWGKLISNFANPSDFKTNYGIRGGSIGELDKVPAGGAYLEAEFSDEQVSYTVAKYGKLFSVQYEALKNDDLGMLGDIAGKLGAAAARTVDKFVLETLVDDNPTIYDGYALFDSTNRSQSNKLGASKALSESTLEEAIIQMRTFTDVDGNQLDIPPKYLLVSPQDEFTALRIVNSDLRPSTANNDINVLKGRVEVLVSSRITSSRWYLIADPTMFDTIEIGFLGGRREPELFEEAANSGHEFAYDAKRYKVRYVFGGAILDWRAFVGANFA